ncbi:MAG: hypothetical protein GDA56_15855 [Hormoscilla sp. GM7CHS1pb]|nr:hypothetical protein [Hormoscilla sp. GM7CHS1pb]
MYSLLVIENGTIFSPTFPGTCDYDVLPKGDTSPQETPILSFPHSGGGVTRVAGSLGLRSSIAPDTLIFWQQVVQI